MRQVSLIDRSVQYVAVPVDVRGWTDEADENTREPTECPNEADLGFRVALRKGLLLSVYREVELQRSSLQQQL